MGLTTTRSSSEYENPVPTGWSRKSVLACALRLWGLKTVVLSPAMLQGPERVQRRSLQLEQTYHVP
jgi:hypothetical protein